MEKIASFKVNHDLLDKGMYVSRIDTDIITYDIRMKKPNGGNYLTPSELHTIEHLFATFARNSKFANSVIYVGPMGCRTGFYLILRANVSISDAIALTVDSMKYIADFEGVIPGSSRIECGNYLDHDIEGAKRVAKDMIEVLKNWKPSDTTYKN